MSDLTGGYGSDIPYSLVYHPELASARIRLSFLMEGVVPPAIATACELGFGHGVSVNVHAAASGVRWYGTDFDSDHAAFGAGLAAASRAEVLLSDDSFADYAARTDLPQFDFITVNAVWSWINAENRAVLVEFIRRHLKIGGVVMISYNTRPGWAALDPLRQMLVRHMASQSAAGDSRAVRVERAVTFAEQMLALNPAYAQRHPEAAAELRALHARGASYLAHEFGNPDWHSTSFAEVGDVLGEARLSFVCSATHLDRIAALHLTEAQFTALAGIQDPVLRETARELMTGTGFRRDYWVRGGAKLHPAERTALLDQLRLVLVTPPRDVRLSVAGALGVVRLNEPLYRPVIALMADHQPRSFAEIGAALAASGLPPRQIVEALTMLIGTGDLAPAQDAEVAASARRHTLPLNGFILRQALMGLSLGVLASPVTGTGIALNRQALLFVCAMADGQANAETLARSVPGGTPEAAQRFLDDTMPMLRALGVL